MASGFIWVWLGNQAPNPAPDRLMLSDEGVLRPLVNDHDPEQSALHLQSVADLPDSVGTASVIDSSHIRVRLTDGFAGTARTHYTVADADGRTARSTLKLSAPFWRKPQMITRSLSSPQTVQAAALSGRNATDLLVAAAGPTGERVLFFQNRQTVAEPFAPPVPVTSNVGGGLSVDAGTIRGSDRSDVVVASAERGRLVWYENQREGFGAPRPIDPNAGDIRTVQTADLDGDGDSDVVVRRRSAPYVVWYENKADGEFGERRPIHTRVGDVTDVHTAPIGGTNLPDVIVAGARGRVEWIENHEGSGATSRFQIRHELGTGIDTPVDVHAADITGNGEHDILVSSAGRSALLWFENRTHEVGGPAFEPKRTVTRHTEHVEGIVTADLNGNGRQDVLGRSSAESTVLFCTNRGDGRFGKVQPITTTLNNVQSLQVADVNRDGQPDVIAASPTEDLVAWYPNYLSSSTTDVTDL